MKKEYNQDYTIDQKDPDLTVLAKELANHGFSRFDKVSYYDENVKGFVETEVPSLRGASVADETGSKEGNYIRMPFMLNWNEDEKRWLEKALLAASNKSKRYVFELHGVSDKEWDDDRSWDASFQFFSAKVPKEYC
jgi:hypothetical protein